jgi:sugar phosphate permease
LLFLPLLAAVVQQFGWRSAILVVAGVLALIIPLVATLFRDWPSDLGMHAYGDADGTVRPVVSTTNPFFDAIQALRDGLRSRDFWLLAASFFVCGASTNGLVGTHLIPACQDQGIPEIEAAALLAMMGVFDLAGTTLSGWLSDRFDNRVLLSWYYALRGLSLIYLPFGLVDTSWGLTAFAVFYGLDWIATVPPTVRLTSDTFGRERSGIMFGWIVASHQLGAATATLGAGVIRSWSGSYERAFLTSGALCLVTAALVLQIRKITPVTIDRTAEPAADGSLALEMSSEAATA